MSSSDPIWGGTPLPKALTFALALCFAFGFALRYLTTTNASSPTRTTPRTTPIAIRPLSVLVKAGQDAEDLDIGVVASKFCRANEKVEAS